MADLETARHHRWVNFLIAPRVNYVIAGWVNYVIVRWVNFLTFSRLTWGNYLTVDSSLMVVSNRTPKDWYALFPNPVLAEGALDRLINSSHYILMEGKSYRPLRRPDRGRAGSDPSSSSFPVDKEEVTTGS